MPQTNQIQKVSALTQILNKFDALAMREKRLIFVAVPSLIIFVMSLLLIEPTYLEIDNVKAKAATQKTQLSNLQTTSTELVTELGRDPDAIVKSQIAALQKQLAQIQASFDSELGHLVSPKAMPILLENLFEQAQGLELLSMESIPPTPIFTDDNQSGDIQLFRQGIQITFQGDYFATRDFFADAEQLQWQLYWKFLNYDVHSHPLATTKLEVFTLSTSEAFIGVN
ncbi:MSHA biogenesis protein MshJ [Glaciecola sp. SC05]|uniref:MSHA biogenesis protein MshJ n=1 Tax=Glaciecola sp. SC05 TaxID=1987355 RepID=UPI003528BFDB